MPWSVIKSNRASVKSKCKHVVHSERLRLWRLSTDGHELHWQHIHHLESDAQPKSKVLLNACVALDRIRCSVRRGDTERECCKCIGFP